MNSKTLLISLVLLCLSGMAFAETGPSAWDLLARDGSQDGALGDLDRKILERLTPAQGRQLAAGAAPEAIVLDSGETLAQFIDKELEKGVATQGLSYFPVDFCILMRTGAAPAGKMTADEIRAFAARGESTDLSAQGGNAAGCGVPNDAEALLVNFIVLFPNGDGALKYYPSHKGGTPGTLIRYTNSSEGIQFDNAVVTELCDADEGLGCTPGDDFRVQTLTAGSHVRIDLLGYFAPAAANDLDCTGCVDNADIADGAVGSADINAAEVQARITGTCASGSSIRTIAQDGTVTCQSNDLQNWERVSFDFSCTAGSICFTFVGCTGGRNVLGGGMELPTASLAERANTYINQSYPLSDTQWQIEASNFNATDVTYRAWATCAPASAASFTGGPDDKANARSGGGVLGEIPQR